MAELTLFISAFLAATLLPFSSEAAFAVALYNDMPLVNALFFASSGNILAIIVNYFFGYFLYTKTKEKLFQSKWGVKIYNFGHRYGYYALLCSWLPFVGDPLTVVAGLVRLRFVWFILFAGILRILRYYLLSFMLGVQ